MENQDWYWYEWQTMENPDIMDMGDENAYLTPEAPQEAIESFIEFYDGDKPIIKAKPKLLQDYY